MADRRRQRPKPDHLDIISDVTWNVELEPEVEEWLDTLSPTEFAWTLPHIERLAEQGNRLRMPASKPLGDGLFELRFDLGPVAWRIPFFFVTGRRIVLLTVFRKQRMNERTEIARARGAMARCINEGHTAEEV
ncbi:MAG TPA: type II toxin-antitoxin system RelE/ParE family toxin [Microthrixaceae bacterium]|nr:type II toxin-antitoxin system RelE/ParE family toxin [Microthrixaceae bacterium]HMT24211.1 type II toxin-antitoxin system RelE/ParE family toxin [Microthrixaceae bacterium]HMT61679.1 type II toxin-antitoxin system RelE/ParE family toxin [Microthrixaceae bacterium]